MSYGTDQAYYEILDGSTLSLHESQPGLLPNIDVLIALLRYKAIGRGGSERLSFLVTEAADLQQAFAEKKNDFGDEDIDTVSKLFLSCVEYIGSSQLHKSDKSIDIPIDKLMEKIHVTQHCRTQVLYGLDAYLFAHDYDSEWSEQNHRLYQGFKAIIEESVGVLRNSPGIPGRQSGEYLAGLMAEYKVYNSLLYAVEEGEIDQVRLGTDSENVLDKDDLVAAKYDHGRLWEVGLQIKSVGKRGRFNIRPHNRRSLWVEIPTKLGQDPFRLVSSQTEKLIDNVKSVQKKQLNQLSSRH